MKEKLIKISEDLTRYGEDTQELRFWIEFFDSLEPERQQRILELYEKEHEALRMLQG